MRIFSSKDYKFFTKYSFEKEETIQDFRWISRKDEETPECKKDIFSSRRGRNLLALTSISTLNYVSPQEVLGNILGAKLGQIN